MNFFSPQELKNICRQEKIYLSRRRGHNFLIDKNVLNKIIRAADFRKDDLILEIGAGFGVLTLALAERAKKVLAVENDKKIFQLLKRNTQSQKNIQLLNEDILRIENQEIVKYLGSAINYKVVSNLPYQITSPVIKKFLTEEPKPKLMVLLVQKEVAQRIVAQPGAMSILSIAVQFYAQPCVFSRVKKTSFWPIPRVDSAILKIEILSKKRRRIDEKLFFQIVKAGFSSKRKQLSGNLSSFLAIKNEEVRKILKKSGLNEKVRAEDLSLKNWEDVYGEIGKVVRRSQA